MSGTRRKRKATAQGKQRAKYTEAEKRAFLKASYQKKKGKRKMKKDFKPHMMYDPKTGKGIRAKTYEKHLELKKKGYVHENPKSLY